MKTRHGFISNSSSSSFIIPKKYLTSKQIEYILNHDEIGEELDIPYAKSWKWTIWIDLDNVEGQTSMDNFDMYYFLNIIGVPMNKVEWSDRGIG